MLLASAELQSELEEAVMAAETVMQQGGDRDPASSDLLQADRALAAAQWAYTASRTLLVCSIYKFVMSLSSHTTCSWHDVLACQQIHLAAAMILAPDVMPCGMQTPQGLVSVMIWL